MDEKFKKEEKLRNYAKFFIMVFQRSAQKKMETMKENYSTTSCNLEWLAMAARWKTSAVKAKLWNSWLEEAI